VEGISCNWRDEGLTVESHKAQRTLLQKKKKTSPVLKTLHKTQKKLAEKVAMQEAAPLKCHLGQIRGAKLKKTQA